MPSGRIFLDCARSWRICHEYRTVLSCRDCERPFVRSPKRSFGTAHDFTCAAARVELFAIREYARDRGQSEISLVIHADSQRARKMRLRRAIVHGPKKCPIREENQDQIPCVPRQRRPDGSAAVHRDSRRAMQVGIFEGKQRSAGRFKFVHESSGGVGEQNIPQRINGECHRRIELPRTFAFVSP